MSIEDSRISAVENENASHDLISDIHQDARLQTSALGGVEVAQAGTTQPSDQQGAQSLLDSAGWQPGADGIRTKGGQRLSATVIFSAVFNQNQSALELIQQQLTDENMQEPSARVDLDRKPPAVVAREYLTETGLIGSE